ncbi:hypothetical protein H8B09_03635 [Paenibacillus sp. PR3]|uniref:Uncharacterized protein n=1 Tax=Paenibacillus terricola TaxID=2763503 RepID=A0ABR8MPB9_9BACL|nr:hypothetical protein [Paenibacillus terricola]MBD3917832.1 hypothetical protein [Paenibacillus terricola]
MNKRCTFLIRIGYISLVIIVLLSIIGCSDNNNDKPKGGLLPDADLWFLETASSLRVIAWNQMTEQEQSRIVGDWREAEVTIAQWSDVPLKQTKVEPEVIYKVTFNTALDALLGPIGIYFDAVTKTIVGYDVRE